MYLTSIHDSVLYKPWTKNVHKNIVEARSRLEEQGQEIIKAVSSLDLINNDDRLLNSCTGLPQAQNSSFIGKLIFLCGFLNDIYQTLSFYHGFSLLHQS